MSTFKEVEGISCGTCRHSVHSEILGFYCNHPEREKPTRIALENLCPQWRQSAVTTLAQYVKQHELITEA